jgi:hypothetical protein
MPILWSRLREHRNSARSGSLSQIRSVARYHGKAVEDYRSPVRWRAFEPRAGFTFAGRLFVPYFSGGLLAQVLNGRLPGIDLETMPNENSLSPIRICRD